MVKIGLQIKAQLENVTNLVATGEDFRWYLKTKCASCGEISAEFQYVTLTESAPLKVGVLLGFELNIISSLHSSSSLSSNSLSKNLGWTR